MRSTPKIIVSNAFACQRRTVADVTITRTGKPIIRNQGGRYVMVAIYLFGRNRSWLTCRLPPQFLPRWTYRDSLRCDRPAWSLYCQQTRYDLAISKRIPLKRPPWLISKRFTARQGCTVIIPFRDEYNKRHLKPTGDLGKIVNIVSYSPQQESCPYSRGPRTRKDPATKHNNHLYSRSSTCATPSLSRRVSDTRMSFTT